MQKTYCYALILFVLNFACVSHAQFSVVYNFGTNPNDPVQPFYAGIISQGQDGNLYSAGYGGGGLQGGATFRMTPGGVITPLWDFANNGDGAIPTGGLILGTDGNFYGTTYDGGFGLTPYGTIFQMTPSGGLSTLYDFQDGNDGALPEAPPVEGLDGNYYGTNCPSCNGPIATGSGSIYVITPPPSSTFSVVYPFDGIHGSEPMAPLILGTDGKFCGVTGYGGTNGCSCGVIFKVTPTGNLTVLYNFDNAHGEIPIGSLVQGKDGNFYGTTTNGGANGLGVVFKVTPKGKLTVL